MPSPSATVKYVTVTVSGGTIACSPDPVLVDQPDTLVVCQLATSGYHFPSTNAIVVTTSGSDFPYSAWTQNATTASIFDKNLVAGDYKYDVTVVNDSTNVPITLDPMIKNGG